MYCRMCIGSLAGLRLENYLHPQNAEDNEEGTADQDNVPDGSEGGDESLHN